MILDYWNVRDELIKTNKKMTYHDLLNLIRFTVLDELDNQYTVDINYTNLYQYSHLTGVNNMNIVVKGHTNVSKQSAAFYRLKELLKRITVPNRLEYVTEYFGDDELLVGLMVIKYYERDYEFSFVMDQISRLMSTIYFYNNNKI